MLQGVARKLVKQTTLFGNLLSRRGDRVDHSLPTAVLVLYRLGKHTSSTVASSDSASQACEHYQAKDDVL